MTPDKPKLFFGKLKTGAKGKEQKTTEKDRSTKTIGKLKDEHEKAKHLVKLHKAIYKYVEAAQTGDERLPSVLLLGQCVACAFLETMHHGVTITLRPQQHSFVPETADEDIDYKEAVVSPTLDLRIMGSGTVRYAVRKLMCTGINETPCQQGGASCHGVYLGERCVELDLQLLGNSGQAVERIDNVCHLHRPDRRRPTRSLL